MSLLIAHHAVLHILWMSTLYFVASTVNAATFNIRKQMSLHCLGSRCARRWQTAWQRPNMDPKRYGQPPNTLAEYALNQFNNLDYFDISLVDGFNVPMNFSPTSGCARGIRCTADINGQCPAQLRAPGGCNNPCTVFKTDQYCCNSGNCGPTAYSRFFKNHCKDAYSYPKDDATSTFTCPGGTNYRVVFCP
ncbi:hypothetical protein M0R45_030211 [Rubus argutus]|uniref:Thaumatin-like protein n=1 Tax=Rubus argutus TaxID=59490 RepID=A0AAW1WCV8_RUBAR